MHFGHFSCAAVQEMFVRRVKTIQFWYLQDTLRWAETNYKGRVCGYVGMVISALRQLTNTCSQYVLACEMLLSRDNLFLE